MARGARKQVTIRTFAFIVIIALGIAPLTISRNDSAGVHIEIVEPDGMIHYGDKVRLRCDVKGIRVPYTIAWQYMENDKDALWQSLDCTDEIYEFILTPENENYYYRVLIMCDDEHFVVAATDTDLRE